MMRPIRSGKHGIQRAAPLVLLGCLQGSLFAFQPRRPALAELYSRRTLRIVPEIVLDDENLPERALLEFPVDMTRDAEGLIYVLDQKADNIKVFETSGRFVRTIGRKGQGPGDFNRPSLFCVAHDRLVVWDQENMRICTLTLKGKFLTSLKIGYLDPWPCKIRGLPDGNIIVERFRSQRSREPQEFLLEIYSPGLELKEVFLIHKIWRRRYIGPAGRPMPAPFPDDVYWELTPEGRIVLAFSEYNEIEIHDPRGGKIASFSHSYEQVPVDEQDKRAFFKTIIYSIDDRRLPYPEAYKAATEFPEYKPSFFGMHVDSEGNVLISRYREDRSQEDRMFDVFAPDGTFISTVRFVGIPPLPRFYQRYGFFGPCLWMIDTGEDGLFRLSRNKITAVMREIPGGAP